MEHRFYQIDQAAGEVDDAICELCSHCGYLRMKQEEGEYSLEEAKSLQTELRYMRRSYEGLKIAVDKILDDHEKRIRTVEKNLWIAVGGGAVIGWLGSVLIRFIIK